MLLGSFNILVLRHFKVGWKQVLYLHFSLILLVGMKRSSISTYAKFSEKLSIFYHLKRIHTFLHQGVRHVSFFSENFVNILKEWTLREIYYMKENWYLFSCFMAKQKRGHHNIIFRSWEVLRKKIALVFSLVQD